MKRTVPLTLGDTTLDLRVTFRVAAEYEKATGKNLFGDNNGMREPANLVTFLHLAAKGQDPDLTPDDIWEMDLDATAISEALRACLHGDDKARSNGEVEAVGRGSGKA